METYGAGVLEGLSSALTIKVHARMCLELQTLVVIVSKIIPEIEAVRPRASGPETLGLLVRNISKAKSLLHRCSEYSILYLALIGDDILSRCNKIREVLEHCLCRIQNIVPLMLAEKISGIVLALRRAAFCLNPPEEEARKLLLQMIYEYGSRIDSAEDFAVSTIHDVCSRLHISSQTALVIEKRSIKRQLDKLDESERNKRKILRIFLHLLKRYRNVTTGEHMDNDSAAHEDPLPIA